jgi:cell division protein FtsB
MKRYDCKLPTPKMNESSSTYGMRERGGGEYVRYEDVKCAIESSDADLIRVAKENDKLEAENDKIRYINNRLENEREILIAENKRLREALEKIAESDEIAQHIAQQALEGEK